MTAVVPDARLWRCALLSDVHLRAMRLTVGPSGLLAIVLHHLAIYKAPLSVVRAGDGERAIIEFSRGGKLAPFLQDARWLAGRGLTGADLVEVGCSLVRAFQDADYFAPNPSGVWVKGYDLHDLIAPKERYCETFFLRMWKDLGFLPSLFNAAPSIILHRDAEQIAAKLRLAYPFQPIAAVPLDGWQTHSAVFDQVRAINHPLVLVSGGPAGKELVVKLARDLGRVVLDVGGGEAVLAGFEPFMPEATATGRSRFWQRNTDMAGA